MKALQQAWSRRRVLASVASAGAVGMATNWAERTAGANEGPKRRPRGPTITGVEPGHKDVDGPKAEFPFVVLGLGFADHARVSVKGDVEGSGAMIKDQEVVSPQAIMGHISLDNLFWDYLAIDVTVTNPGDGTSSTKARAIILDIC